MIASAVARSREATDPCAPSACVIVRAGTGFFFSFDADIMAAESDSPCRSLSMVAAAICNFSALLRPPCFRAPGVASSSCVSALAYCFDAADFVRLLRLCISVLSLVVFVARHVAMHCMRARPKSDEHFLLHGLSMFLSTRNSRTSSFVAVAFTPDSRTRFLAEMLSTAVAFRPRFPGSLRAPLPSIRTTGAWRVDSRAIATITILSSTRTPLPLRQPLAIT